MEGLKILDLTRVLSGPYATMILADLGADVIKLEQPVIGDDSRHFGPFVKDESAYFMSINRNKRSITLNLKKEEGKKIFRQLIEEVDVVVENFRPGTMEKLGIGYTDLKAYNSKLIYATISGFGQTGPYSKRAAYDGIVQAMGGIMSITGEKNGNPVRVGPSIGDIIAGIFCALGILAALRHRDLHGEGQMVDVAMLDSQVAVLENAISRYLLTGNIPKPDGNTHPSIFPFETFPTTNGEIMIAAGNNALWSTFCKVIERDDLIEDERFCTNPLRGKNHDEMFDALSSTLSKKSKEEWIVLLDEVGVPCSLINGIDKVVENAQVIARDMIVEVAHPSAGTVKIPGIPIKMSETPGEIRKASPLLGENNFEILQEWLGFNVAEIERLKSEKII